MSREFIGESRGWEDDPESDTLQAELAIKYIKQTAGKPPRGVDLQVTCEGCEIGNQGEETQYPVISVMWNDGITRYPSDHIGKCIEAYERFELPEEIYERGRLLEKLHTLIDRLQTYRGIESPRCMLVS